MFKKKKVNFKRRMNEMTEVINNIELVVLNSLE